MTLTIEKVLEACRGALNPKRFEDEILLSLFQQGRVISGRCPPHTGLRFHDSIHLEIDPFTSLTRVAFRRNLDPRFSTLDSARDSIVARSRNLVRDRFTSIGRVRCGSEEHLIVAFRRSDGLWLTVALSHLAATEADLTLDLLSAEQTCLVHLHRRRHIESPFYLQPLGAHPR